MWPIFKKEISTYFASMVGYIAIGIFLILNALLFWIFPTTSIIENGYADLGVFFRLVPYFLMFLIPAITMKSFAGEQQDGTLEWLRSAPISDLKLILGKYYAALFLGILALAPTFLYVIAIYFLALPQGNIDFGSIAGSYLGILLILHFFTSIGIWSSIKFQNPISSFLVGILLCFIFFYGFSALTPLILVDPFNQIISYLDLNQHYESMSRGVLESRNIIFLGTGTFVFLYLSHLKLVSNRLPSKPSNIYNSLSIFIFLIALQLGANTYYVRLDFTDDKRFTLSEFTKNTLKNLDEKIKIQVFLNGNAHPSFKRLETSVHDILVDLTSMNRKQIQVEWIDPFQHTTHDHETILQNLVDRGVNPVQIQIQKDDSQIQKLIFPYAIIQSNGKEQVVNLLSSLQSENYENTINRAIETLEYSFISSIRKLESPQKPLIAFSQGHGELTPKQQNDAASTLAKGFQVMFLDLNKVLLEDIPKINLLIISKPTQIFSEEVKFKLDYFLMQGGKLIVAIDQLTGSLDSLKHNGQQNVVTRDLNLDDLFFNYGFRLNYDLLADLQSSLILVTQDIKTTSGQPLESAPWPFHPLISSSHNHPVFSKLDPINLQYTGTVDTIQTDHVQKEFVLFSSLYNRVFQPPVPISLNLLQDLPAPEELKSSPKPVALLLKGSFRSAFALRKKPLSLPVNRPYPDRSDTTQIFVIADGDIFRNNIHESDQSTYPLGWDPVTKQTFSNKTMLLNLVDYMIDDETLISLRDKKVKMYLLNTVAVRKSKFFWQSMSFAIPLTLLVLGGIIQSLLRKKKWGKPL